MASYSDLVNVSFQDATAHQSVSGGDVLGVILPYHWGPVGKLNVLNRTEFYEAYPESLPLGIKFADAPADFYFAYAQVKKFFENGGSSVEVYRPATDNYYGITKDTYAVTLKYPGSIPASLLPTGTNQVKLEVSDTEVVIKAVGTTEVVLESWQGQFTDPSAMDSGQYTHFSKVLNASQFLQCIEAEGVSITQVTDTIPTYTYNTPDYDEGLDLFGDVELSRATLVISSTPADSEINTAIANLAEENKTKVAVVGFPLDTTPAGVISAYNNLPKGKKFTVNVYGIEYVTIFSNRVRSNCVGGYCGALANIANLVRINQVASAKTYGTYSGALVESPSFSQVLQLHEEGLVTIYNSATGPQIFGIHNSLYQQKPNSYFSKINVVRVLAAILRNIYPIAFEAVHTDAAANAVTRASFSSRFNSVINDFVSQQNLQPDSFADLSDAINTDYLTKGGTVLNAILSLHFIGLVEKIDIKVVATDSSVNIENI